MSEWQLVNIALGKDGGITYTFRHRAMFTAGIMSAAVTQTVKTQHPRAGWGIGLWFAESDITAPESRMAAKEAGSDDTLPRT